MQLSIAGSEEADRITAALLEIYKGFNPEKDLTIERKPLVASVLEKGSSKPFYYCVVDFDGSTARIDFSEHDTERVKQEFKKRLDLDGPEESPESSEPEPVQA